MAQNLGIVISLWACLACQRFAATSAFQTSGPSI